MLKLLHSPEAARWATVALVIIVGLSVGRQASVGMDVQQWIGAAAAVIGSVVLAAMVYQGEPERQED